MIFISSDSISKQKVQLFAYLFSKWVLSVYYVPSAMLVFGGYKNERKKFCLHDIHILAEDIPNTGKRQMFSICLCDKYMSNYNVLCSRSNLYICMHMCVCFIGTVTMLWRMPTVYIHNMVTDCIPYIPFLGIITNKTFHKEVEIAVVSFFLIKLTSDNCNTSTFVKGPEDRIFYMATFCFFNT